MTGHLSVQRRTDAALITSLANMRLAYTKKWRVEMTTVAMFLATKPQKPWISEEEAARAARHRSLLDDNPASG